MMEPDDGPFTAELPSAVTKVLGDQRLRLAGDALALGFQGQRTVATVEEGGLLRRWDVETGRQRNVLALNELESCWTFSPDGKLLVSGSSGLSLWDALTGELRGQVGSAGWTRTVAFRPDGLRLASGHDDDTVRLWDRQTGKLLDTFTEPTSEICAIAFSPDGRRLAAAGEDRNVWVLDADTAELLLTLTGHTDRVDSLAWSPDGSVLTSAGWDTSVRVWDADTGDLKMMLNGQGECVHAVRCLPEGRLICGDSEAVVRLWHWPNLSIEAELLGHRGPVRHLAVGPGHRLAASAGSDRCVYLWDLATRKALLDLEGPRAAVRRIAVAANGAAASRPLQPANGRVINGSDAVLGAVHDDHSLIYWDLSTGTSLPTPDPVSPAISAEVIAAGPDGRWAVGTEDGQVLLYEGAGGPVTRVWQSQQEPTRLLAFSQDGAMIAASAGIDGMVRIWRVADGSAVVFIPRAVDGGSIEAIAFHPTGSPPRIAVAGLSWHLGDAAPTEGLVTIWDLETHERLQTLSAGGSRVAFSPNGRYLAVATPTPSVLLFDPESGELLRELRDQNVACTGLAFDPTGRLLASAGEDHAIRLWSTDDWRIHAIIDLRTPVTDLTFTPDGMALAVGNADSTCYLVGIDANG